VKKVASAPARSAAPAVAMTTVRLPRRIAPPPAPTTVPPIRKSARLAGEVHADATRTISPMSVGASPAAISLDADRRVVVACTSTPAPKFRKIAKPVSAAEGWCSGPARNAPASPANNPPTAKIRNPPVVAAMNWPRACVGARSRCGR
jgi:hypothetical protein